MQNVCFVTVEAGLFLNQRLPLANGLRAAGHEVSLWAPPGGDLDQVRALGYSGHPVPFNRRGKNIFRELGVVWALRNQMLARNPDTVLGFALKPSLYASLAAFSLRPSRRPRIVGTITGLGFIYTEDSASVRVIRWLLNTLFFILARVTPTVFAFQNDDDCHYFHRILPSRARLRVPGSGIDCSFFSPGGRGTKTDGGKSARQEVLFPARMLRHKGVYELLEAIPQVTRDHPTVRFVFLGSPDPLNPTAVPDEEFLRLIAAGDIDWVPTVPREQTVEYYRRATIVCLPSYREGLPMALMEAAACGVPLVATDVPGCREVCLDKVTGVLVPPQDANALADAIIWLLDRPDERLDMGRKARQLIIEKFSLERVVSRYCELIKAVDQSSIQY